MKPHPENVGERGEPHLFFSARLHKPIVPAFVLVRIPKSERSENVEHARRAAQVGLARSEILKKLKSISKPMLLRAAKVSRLHGHAFKTQEHKRPKVGSSTTL